MYISGPVSSGTRAHAPARCAVLQTALCTVRSRGRRDIRRDARPATGRATADLTMTDRPRTRNADHPSRLPVGPGRRRPRFAFGFGCDVRANLAVPGVRHAWNGRPATKLSSVICCCVFRRSSPTLRPPRPRLRPALVAHCGSRPTARTADQDRRCEA